MQILPNYYDSDEVGALYLTRGVEVRNEADRLAEEHRITLAQDDTDKIKLLLIDKQVDFIHEDGSLSVPGAVDSLRRIIEWGYKNVEDITQIQYSLDSHLPTQIFDISWWVEYIYDNDGNIIGTKTPDPFSVITSKNIGHKFMPRLHKAWSFEYVKTLETQANKPLMLWPPHVPIGGVGNALMPALHEFITFWSVARVRNPEIKSKGEHPRTEHYSIFEPEVKLLGSADNFDNGLINDLMSYKAIFLAGQAKSHCVLESLRSIVRVFSVHDPSVLERVYVFTDAMDSVYGGPEGFDDKGNIIGETFEEICQPIYESFSRDHGINLITTNDNISDLI